MIDRFIVPLQGRILQPIGRVLADRGIEANHLTLAGFAIGVLAFFAIVFEQFTIGLILILLNRLFDGLDGVVARINGATDRGAFLDIALDFAFYSLIPLAFAIANPALNALPAAVLIASFVGTGSSFLAFSIIAERRGLKADAYPSKGIYYLGGLTEGFETIALFVAFAIWPNLFPILAYIFAMACTLTTILRWSAGWQIFTNDQ